MAIPGLRITTIKCDFIKILFKKMFIPFLPQKYLIFIFFTFQFPTIFFFIVLLKLRNQFCQTQVKFSTLANPGSSLYIFTNL